MKHPIPDFSIGHTLVVGDLMLDRYWSGGAERISPEAPVPVVHVKEIAPVVPVMLRSMWLHWEGR